MSSKKRKAMDRNDKEEENGDSTCRPDNLQRVALASLLANDTAIRSTLRSENLLLASFSRQGLMGTVATAAALWIQDRVLLPCAAADAGRVEWPAIRARVAGDGAATTILGQSIIHSLPETIPITNQKRKHLGRVKQGETKKAPPRKKQAPVPSAGRRAKSETQQAVAAMASMQGDSNNHGEERDPTEIVEDQEDYD
eukprot:scaffold6395_cov159-Amphora_coffeaeformis.AAC.1